MDFYRADDLSSGEKERDGFFAPRLGDDSVIRPVRGTRHAPFLRVGLCDPGTQHQPDLF